MVVVLAKASFTHVVSSNMPTVIQESHAGFSRSRSPEMLWLLCAAKPVILHCVTVDRSLVMRQSTWRVRWSPRGRSAKHLRRRWYPASRASSLPWRCACGHNGPGNNAEQTQLPAPVRQGRRERVRAMDAAGVNSHDHWLPCQCPPRGPHVQTVP
jgi:hypothetical protein